MFVLSGVSPYNTIINRQNVGLQQESVILSENTRDNPQLNKNALDKRLDRSLDSIHPKIKNDPALVPDAFKEDVAALKALAAQFPGYDPTRFTDNHLAAILAFTETGDIRSAATKSSFSYNGLKSLLQQEFSISLVQFILKNDLKTTCFAMAIKALKDVLSDVGASPASRMAAARTTKDWLSELEKKEVPVSGKPLSDMTVSELAGLIHKLEGAARLEANTIDITPSKQ